MKFHLFLIVWALTVAGPMSRAEAADAFKDLARVECFAFGGIGAAGTFSPGEITFRRLLAEPKAEENFRKLLEVGDREAKCYALVALRKLEPQQFPALAARFQRDQTPVHTVAGCSPMDRPMNSVVVGIAKGDYDYNLSAKGTQDYDLNEKPKP